MPNTPNISPPKWADRFLKFYCKNEYLEEIQGDAHELFEARISEGGNAFARRNFVWDVLRFFKWSNIKQLNKVQINSTGMFKNYIKIAWRGLVRSKMYSIINLSGLAVGITVFMLILLYVKDEISYDKYHAHSERIYRIASDLKTPDNSFQFAITPPHLGELMQSDFPEVTKFVRLSKFFGAIKKGVTTFNDVNSVYADVNFFELFDIPLIEGDRKTVLAEPFSIVVTKSTAEKYYGTEDAIGKILEVEGVEQPFIITGVMEDVPSNTHFDFDLLISMETRNSLGIIQEGQWFYLDYYTYLLLPENVNLADLQSKMPDFIEKHIGQAQKDAQQSYEFEFQPLADIHLNSHRDNEIGANGDMQYIYIFSMIAVFIVVIACVNFINLSTARASHRSKEIGMRKVVGAIRRQLVTQFLVESMILSLISFVTALFLVIWAIPSFNTLINKQLLFDDLFIAQLTWFWIGFVVLIGSLAGLYPALVLSRFNPIKALRSASMTGSRNSALRQGMVVFQLMISTVLIVGAIVINRQLYSMQNQNLGFDTEEMLVIKFGRDQTIMENLETIKTALNGHANVVNTSYSRFAPTAGVSNWYTSYEKAPGETKNASFNGYMIDYDFMATYGLSTVAGRSFDKAIASDMEEGYMINEAAVKAMGFENNEAVLGKEIYQFAKLGKIVGVVKDFNFKALHSAIEPLVIQMGDPSYARVLTIKLSPGSDLQTLVELEAIWKKVVPEKPFQIQFVDEGLKLQYEAEARTEKVFSLFSGLALFIAALGLFALSTLSAEQQKRNISVRKVLGASGKSIAYSFSLQFLKLALFAFLVSAPIVYFAADSWLENFTYRIDVNLSILLLGGAITAIITLLTISFQSFRLTRVNPAQNLRSE
jgi:putative ABC transport system permease protein